MLGNVVYWTASSVALLLFSFGVISIWRSDGPDSFATYSVIAGLIWFAGKAARYLLAE